MGVFNTCTIFSQCKIFHTFKGEAVRFSLLKGWGNAFPTGQKFTNPPPGKVSPSRTPPPPSHHQIFIPLTKGLCPTK